MIQEQQIQLLIAMHLFVRSRFKDSVGTVEIETANGIIQSEVYEIESFSSLGINKLKFEIQVYDFIAHGIFSDYNGLLGLDFLEGTNFCIDTIENTISIH